jgi:23S rRNA (uracil1939-C5)-methyltransferase
MLEPLLFAAVERLRIAAPDFLAPGETAEIALTRTDSGLDLLIDAAMPPYLGAFEALAGMAEEADFARIVWRRGGDDTLVVERRPVRMLFSGVAVALPPGGFVQASAAAERVLVEAVLAGAGARRPVLDLFAGLGTFTFALMREGRVHAVEDDAAAAAALAQAVASTPGVTVDRRDLAREPMPPKALARYAVAVLDPPRSGAARQAARYGGRRFLQPGDLRARRALLVGGGLRVERLVPIDQFVWTAHLELVCLFRR